jgi:hypothetical protein
MLWHTLWDSLGLIFAWLGRLVAVLPLAVTSERRLRGVAPAARAKEGPAARLEVLVPVAHSCKGLVAAGLRALERLLAMDSQPVLLRFISTWEELRAVGA